MDAVILYCEVNEGFKQRYNEYVKGNVSYLPAMNKYRSYCVLDIQISMIRKYMKFIDNIFVLVSDEDQIPSYVDQSQCKFILHKEIIPEEILPSFNSSVIELFIHRIPGLSEQFIYFNDDMFVLGEVDESMFFIDGKPNYDYELIAISDPKTSNVYINSVYNATLLAAEYVDSLTMTEENENPFATYEKYKYQYAMYNHNAKPYLKSTCEEVFAYCEKMIIENASIVRQANNYTINLYSNVDVMRGNFNNVKNDCIMLWNDNTDEIFKVISNPDTKLFCINDAQYSCYDRFKKNLRAAFEANLNNIPFTYKPYTTEDKIVVTGNISKDIIGRAHWDYNVMMIQTLKPSKVVLYASKDEIDELTENIISMVNEKPDVFEVRWVERDYKDLNNIIYAIKDYPDAIIIPLNKNFYYTHNYVELLHSDYVENGRNNPVSYDKFGEEQENICYGIFNVIEGKHFGDDLTDIAENLILTDYEKYKDYINIIYSLVPKYRGYSYIRGSMDPSGLRMHKELLRGEEPKELRKDIIKEIKEYIESKYNGESVE